MSATMQALSTATQSSAPAQRSGGFPALLERYKGEIARALPRHLNPDQMLRIALTCFRMNPKLEQCDPRSVFAAVVQASQIGLRPGMLGECYLIPYKTECTLQLGYQGLLELVRRSGMVESIGAYLVYEKDAYAVRFGTDPGVTHEPFLDGDRGAVKFGYAVAHIKGGGRHVEVMTLAEIGAIRDRSQNVRNAKKWNKETPWDTDFDEMARKTLLRRICKYLPKSNEVALAINLDDAAQRGAQGLNLGDVVADVFVAPDIEGEATEAHDQHPAPAAIEDAPTGAAAMPMPGQKSKATAKAPATTDSSVPDGDPAQQMPGDIKP